MTREELIKLIDSNVECYILDDETFNYIQERAAIHLEEKYPPASGKNKQTKELCNVLLAYYDALVDADIEELEVDCEDFGIIMCDTMHDLLDREL